MLESIELPAVSLASKLGPSHCGVMANAVFKIHRRAKIDARPFILCTGRKPAADTEH